jgi:predicted AAA+ superfamily ATPase
VASPKWSTGPPIAVPPGSGLTSNPSSNGKFAIWPTSQGGCLLNYTHVATLMKMPQTTLERYLALLETVFLFHPVPAWSTSRGTMLAKRPKVYLNDPGLAAYLLELDPERLAALPRPFGPLLENYVMAELEKQITWSRKRPMLYHFRTQTGLEVDFVIESQGGEVVGIEVKASGTLDPRDWKGMLKLADLAGPRFVRGIILYRGDTILPVAPNLPAVPLQYLQAVYQRRPEAMSSPAESPSSG